MPSHSLNQCWSSGDENELISFILDMIWSNLTRQCIQLSNYNGKTLLRFWTQERCPIAHPYHKLTLMGELWTIHHEYLVEKWPCNTLRTMYEVNNIVILLHLTQGSFWVRARPIRCYNIAPPLIGRAHTQNDPVTTPVPPCTHTTQPVLIYDKT